MPLTYSNNFVATVKHGHKIITLAQIVTNDIVQSLPLSVVSGNAKEDATVAIRTQASCTLMDKTGTLVPSQLGDLLFPGVNEIKLSRGLVYPDNTTELIPLGVFGFEAVNIHDSGEVLTVAIEGLDRSNKVSKARFSDIYIVVAGTSIGQAIINIVSSRVICAFEIDNAAFSSTVNKTTFDRGDDPWSACNTLAAVGGFEVLFGRDGQCIVRQAPSLTATPKWLFLSGLEAVMLEITRSLKISDYNHVYEIAEGGDIVTPFYAEAKDQTSIDTTGDRPIFHVSSLYTAISQCQAAADAKLTEIRGTLEDVAIQIIPNPAIATSDICSITNARTKIDSSYIIDKVTTPLEATNGQYLGVRKRVIG